MNVKFSFDETNVQVGFENQFVVKDFTDKTLVKLLMLKGDKGDTVSAEWGTITGTLSSQTDLKNALDSKANTSDLSSVATSGDYEDLTNTPTIPTKTSDLTNDSGFIDNTVNDLTNYTKTSDLSSVATSGSYNDLSNKPTIPTKTSDLTNDSGFITPSYHDNTKVDKDSIARLDNVVSRNLANANNYLLGHINMSNGGIDEDNNWAYTKVKIKPNTQYTYQLTSTENQEYEVAQYQSNGTYIVGNFGNWTSGKQSYTFTTSNNTDYILIAWRNDLDHSNIQVEEGTVATDYVPYLNLEEVMQENDIYSTNEIKIGTWVDRRNVYRKVYHITSGFTSNMNIPTGITNFGQPIKVYGWVNALGFKVIGGGYIQDASWPRFTTIVYQVGTNIELQLGDWIAENASDMMLVLEYTKTTD